MMMAVSGCSSSDRTRLASGRPPPGTLRKQPPADGLHLRAPARAGTREIPTMIADNIEDFRALEPFFRVIEEGLAGLVDGGHFFDLLADDAVFEFIITVPGYPRRVAGRDKLI